MPQHIQMLLSHTKPMISSLQATAMHPISLKQKQEVEQVAIFYVQ